MSKPHDDDAELIGRLLDKLVDGIISPSEFEQLEQLLQRDPQAQELYFKYLDLDSDLRTINQADQVALPDAAVASRRPQFSRRAMVMLAGAAIAASLLVVAFVRRPVTGPARAEARPDAILVQSAGGQFFRDVMPPVGQALHSQHTYALTKGLIELKFGNGAEVILEAPAVLEVVSQDRLIMRQGVCSVHAPPGAEGFRVITPQTEVVDWGTRFSVAVTEGGDTEVQVVEGAAEIIQPNSRTADGVLLKERQARRSAAGQILPARFSDEQYRRELPDRVIAFQMAGSHSGRDNDTDGELQKVIVQRGGHRVEYPAEQLIGVEVTHFRGGRSSQHLSVPVGANSETERSRRDLLESDCWLHTGILNMGGARDVLTQDPVLSATDAHETTPGMGIRFRTPIVNDVGPDILFFELQSVLNPPDGDAFHVSPMRFQPGLQSITVRRYDITLNSSEAIPIPSFDLLQSAVSANSLEQLLAGTYMKRKSSIPFFAIAVGIDLSQLGYDQGAKVSELFFQDAADDVEHQVDPVFIGGLPALAPDSH